MVTPTQTSTIRPVARRGGRRVRRTTTWMIILAGLCGTPKAPAQSFDGIDGYSAARNDRFTSLANGFSAVGGTPLTPNPGFYLGGYDFSGVGWLPNPTP